MIRNVITYFQTRFILRHYNTDIIWRVRVSYVTFVALCLDKILAWSRHSIETIFTKEIPKNADSMINIYYKKHSALFSTLSI